MFAKGLINRMINNKQPTITAPLKFYKAANGLPVHGSLYADHAQFNLKDEPIIFSFVDIEAPAMTPEVLAHIWHEAERQGFVVKSMRSYVTMFTVQPAPPMNLTGSTVNERQGRLRGPRRPFDNDTNPKHQQRAH